ncbi:hypothetical protein HAX54_004620 [Datura stramonium]|uniref:Uncharacterized protein n=1 Tax=Datura stramonium TaxID=4076 RepID=A0ABS8T9M0_DATST|nr:hypothetical protein [Datura stramonium]
MRTVERVIDLATKRDKYAQAFKISKLKSGLNDPLPTMMSGDADVSTMDDRHVSPLTSALLKMAQIAHTHNAHLLKLANIIPPYKSTHDDWCMGYIPSSGVAARVVTVDDPPRNDVPPIMNDGHYDDPYRVAPICYYHEARTFPNRWVMTSQI